VRRKLYTTSTAAREIALAAGLTAAVLPAFLLAIPAIAQDSAGHAAIPAYAAARTRADIVRFRARVESALAEAHAQRAFWGILVADQDTGEPLFELNADHFFVPASNAKIVTSALALATLGPDYTFQTTLESDVAPDSSGSLRGDLLLVGRGDPDLSNRKFPYAGKVEHEGAADIVLAEMADAVAAKGVKEIAGDIVADDTFFPFDPYPAGWNIGDLYFTFGAPVGAIAFNDNSFTLTVMPGPLAGEPAILAVEPGVALDGFGHEIITGPADAKPDFAVVRRPGIDFILLRGLMPLGHEPIKLDLALTDPAKAAAASLKELLEARGVRVAGTVRVNHAPPPDTSDAGDLPPIASGQLAAQPARMILAEHHSPSLLEILRVTNKVSQNLYAELLLRTVAREKAGVGSTVAAMRVEQDFLKQAGIADGDIALSDGSGLSHDDLVTPRAIVQLLRYAAQQPWGADYFSTFPLAGQDGTLETRMKGTAAAGVVRAKTGALEHARALSGYATTVAGAHLVFAIFTNNSVARGHDATSVIDSIAVAMVETLRPAPKPAAAKTKKKK
jgi:serine-type D-Ala-D-Ala carboxypeptidase/endopeptidase (penicillin-binding protein 4)